MLQHATFAEKDSQKSLLIIKIIKKLETITILNVNFRSSAFSICNLRFDMPNKVPVDFQNGSNYDYHFIIQELASKFEGQFQYLAENMEK